MTLSKAKDVAKNGIGRGLGLGIGACFSGGGLMNETGGEPGVNFVF